MKLSKGLLLAVIILSAIVMFMCIEYGASLVAILFGSIGMLGAILLAFVEEG